MSNSRDQILARLRSVPADSAGSPPPPRMEIPERDQTARINQFRMQLEAVRAEVHEVDRDNWTSKLQELCQQKGIGTLLHAPDGPLGDKIESTWQPESTTSLVSYRSNIDEWKEEIFFGLDASITSTRAGIAHTGTLVLWPTPAEPRSYSLVPPVHFALLDAEQLYNSFSDLIEAEQWQQGLPTNALLISGPSKTADIEQTLAYGIHGPTQLIVLLIK
ncbi:MAG: lactate utilization protein [Gammaproteobacteria bacterium]|nr:lactate utilization protein [Gammaproteobacteria bacterium]